MMVIIDCPVTVMNQSVFKKTGNGANHWFAYGRSIHFRLKSITPARPGNSLHEAGWAIDINWVNEMTSAQRASVLGNATAAGLNWGGHFRTPDHPHFYQNPGNRRRLIEQAQRDFASGAADECTCGQ